MHTFKVFLSILAVGLISSLVPFGYIGLMFGSPAVVINSVILTLLYSYFDGK